MNSNQNTPLHPSVAAQLELELSNWQFTLDTLNQSSGDEESINMARRQVNRLRIELGIDVIPGSPDTHVRSTTHGDEPAFVVIGDFDGLSKREYMATAIIGNLAATFGLFHDPVPVAATAVNYADALINALNQKAQ